MRWLAGAVSIIPSGHAGRRYGMTATAVCSASAEPPTVLICVNKLATTHGAIAKSKLFCVNVLRADDWELSTSFSGAQTGEGRFKSRDWAKLATGSPVLIDSLASFDCRVVNKLLHGTHTIFLGQVEQVLLGKKGKLLLYSEGRSRCSRGASPSASPARSTCRCLARCCSIWHRPSGGRRSSPPTTLR